MHFFFHSSITTFFYIYIDFSIMVGTLFVEIRIGPGCCQALFTAMQLKPALMVDMGTEAK